MIKQVKLKIEGMHCVSCAMNIDGELEDLAGVKEAKTSYSKSETTVSYDSDKVSLKNLVSAVKTAGYACRPASDSK